MILDPSKRVVETLTTEERHEKLLEASAEAVVRARTSEDRLHATRVGKASAKVSSIMRLRERKYAD